MAQRTYPALIERGDLGCAVTFPDLPGCVSWGASLDEAVSQAADALSLHLEGMAEDGEAFPEPTDLDRLVLNGRGSPNGVWAAITVEAPDAAERVNVYLPKSLLERVDRYASAVGLNRSAVFGQAARAFLEGRQIRIGGGGPAAS